MDLFNNNTIIQINPGTTLGQATSQEGENQEVNYRRITLMEGKGDSGGYPLFQLTRVV